MLSLFCCVSRVVVDVVVAPVVLLLVVVCRLPVVATCWLRVVCCVSFVGCWLLHVGYCVCCVPFDCFVCLFCLFVFVFVCLCVCLCVCVFVCCG